MKRMLGVAMAAYAAFATAETAHAQSPTEQPECARVYDTTLGELGKDSAALTKQITRYEQADVTAYVQILAEGDEAGITTNDPDKSQAQAEAYSKSLMSRCEWGADQTIVITLAVDHRRFNVYRTENAEENVTEDEVRDIQDVFGEALRDTTTPYQEDVAEFMGNIDPAEDDTNIVPYVIGGGVVLAALVGVGILATRGGSGGYGGGGGGGSYYGGSSSSYTYSSSASTAVFSGGDGGGGSVGGGW